MYDNELLGVNYGAGDPPGSVRATDSPSGRPETYDYRGRSFDAETLDLRRMRPGDTILTDGATITIDPSGSPRVALAKGYENGRSAGRNGPVIVPAGPPNADLGLNRMETRAHQPWWLWGKVPNKRPWDYKQQGRQYEPFGNFNYGAVGAETWVPDEIWQRGAGWAQGRARTTKPEYGSYILGTGSYGDDPVDQYWIEQGLRYGRR